MDKLAGQLAMASSYIDMASTVVEGACGLVPDPNFGFSFFAHTAINLPISSICQTLANIGLRTLPEVSFETFETLYYSGVGLVDANDCDPSQTKDKKLFCDLHCIEDAVRKGDSKIMQSLRVMHTKLLEEVHNMFEHYTNQVFTKVDDLGAREDHN